MTIEKTMRRRLETINKELAACDAKRTPLLKERAKIVAFLEEDVHDANAQEMGLGPDIAKQNHDAAQSDLAGVVPERNGLDDIAPSTLAAVKAHGKEGVEAMTRNRHKVSAG